VAVDEPGYGTTFFYSGRTTPLAQYWDEDVAYKRDIYDFSYGRFGGRVRFNWSQVSYIFTTTYIYANFGFVIMQVIDDLMKEHIPNSKVTPSCMVSNTSDEVTDLSKRLTYVEKNLTVLMKKIQHRKMSGGTIAFFIIWFLC
jgi:hypothetical protein